jgi:hypothetical protein
VNLSRDWASARSTFGRWLLGIVPVLVAATVVVAMSLLAERATVVALLASDEHADATVVSRENGRVELEYVHEVVGMTTTEVDAGTLVVGEIVEIAYDRDDPYYIEIAARRPPRDVTVLVVIGGAIAAAATLAASQWRAKRMRALIADESPAFRMLGVVHRSWWSSIPRLSLYALDASPGSRPVCTIAMADIRLRDDGWESLDVDVKGLPRPAGCVVARRGATILFPRSRALLTARQMLPQARVAPGPARTPPWSASPPLPSGVSAPAWPPPMVPPPPPRSTASGRDLRTRLLITGAAIALGVFVTIIVAVVSMAHGRATDRWIATGRPAVATIADRDDGDYKVAVDVVLSRGAAAQQMMAPVDFPEEFEDGRAYPAVISADDAHVRLLVEPYDRIEPILWAAIPTGILLWHLVRRLLGG